MSNREFDVVVYGASGYTGRLVAEYLAQKYGDGSLSWAMAGRSAEKLAAVRAEMAIPDSIALIEADSDQPNSIASMVQRAKVVITTVGPYQLYGDEVVRQCAQHGTDYVDLCGEPTWMYKTISEFSDIAKASGARIVHCCGFDSIPFDLGVFQLQQYAIAKTGAPLATIKGRVRVMKGSFSGGTLASLKATSVAVRAQPELRDVMANPFALCEHFIGPEQPRGDKPLYDDELGGWSTPFVMAVINTKNVHRSNLLLGHRYGTNFCYDEMLFSGEDERPQDMTNFAIGGADLKGNTLQPGEGPTREEREAGNYDIAFLGATHHGELLMSSVSGDRDPGYGSTSKMIAESALCLLHNPDLASGGVWTPAAAMGEALIERLEAHAGLQFTIETP